MAVEGATDSVVGVKGPAKATDDGCVNRVDSGGWIVFVPHGSAERSE